MIIWAKGNFSCHPDTDLKSIRKSRFWIEKPCPHIIPHLGLFSHSLYLRAAPEMSVRMSNLDNERDERDEDSHEDRGISECRLISHGTSFDIATERLNQQQGTFNWL